MTKKLFASALSKFIAGIFLVGLFVFLPAGTLSFINGWIFMAVLFVPMTVLGGLLMIKNPALLEKRLQAKEQRSQQDLVQKLSGLMFIGGFVVAGLGFRFGWFTLPLWSSYAAAAVFLICYGLYAEVMRENTYLSRTVQVQENQKVVSTGLYSIVRHPMYSVTVILFLTVPLILGSVYSFAVFLCYPFIIGKRIKDEETLLEKELEGYSEYKSRVKYRLIPFIW